LSEKQKKLAIIFGTIVIGLLLLLSSRKGNSTTIVNQSEMPPIQVTIPSLNLPERSPIAIVIPGLPSGSQYEYNAISPCMCNGASQNAYPTNTLNLEFVTNQGSSGPNIYNYNYQQNSGFSGFVGIPYGTG
jgi:hypothetical protein